MCSCPSVSSPMAACLRSVALFCTVVVAACGSETPASTADAATATVDAAGVADGAGAADGAAQADAAIGAETAAVGACAVSPAVTGSSPIAINEVQGKSDDWVELVNTGSEAVSLGGMVLTDKGSDGCPKIASGLTFPAAATLAAGARLLVVGKKSPLPGQQTDCLAIGPKTCWHMAFKVSASGGDGIFLIANKQVVSAVAVPATTLTDTAAWGRIPDGTGAFTATVPTPGEANKK